MSFIAERGDAAFREAFAHAAIGMALVSLDGRWLQVAVDPVRRTPPRDRSGPRLPWCTRKAPLPGS